DQQKYDAPAIPLHKQPKQGFHQWRYPCGWLLPPQTPAEMLVAAPILALYSLDSGYKHRAFALKFVARPALKSLSHPPPASYAATPWHLHSDTVLGPLALGVTGAI